jgi:hypothetical protein
VVDILRNIGRNLRVFDRLKLTSFKVVFIEFRLVQSGD